MPQFEKARLPGAAHVRSALGVVPDLSYELVGSVFPVLDSVNAGLVKTGVQHATLRVRTAALPALVYVASAFIRPRPGRAMRVLSVEWYVHDNTGVASVTPFTPANLRTVDTQLRLLHPAGLDSLDAPDAADLAEIVSGAGVAVAETGVNNPAVGVDYQHGYLVFGQFAAATGPFVITPGDTLAHHWPPGGVVLQRRDATSALGDGLAIDWTRTALLADEDELIASVYYTSAPYGMVPPL